MRVNTYVRVHGSVTLLIRGPPAGVHRPIYVKLIPPPPRRLKLKGEKTSIVQHPKPQGHSVLTTGPPYISINMRNDQHMCCT